MLTLVLVAGAVAVGAIAQAISGIGFVLACGPLLVALLGPREGVRLAILLSLLVNLVVLSRTRRDADLRTAGLLLIPAALSLPVAAAALRQAPERVAAAVAGGSALVGALALAAGLRWPAATGRAGAVGAGLLSGAMNAAAGIGGPAIALYAANARWPAAAMRSTAQVYFLGLNAVGLVALGLPHEGWGLLVTCFAALLVGLWAGGLLAQRASETHARHLTLGLAGAGGLLVLFGAVRP